jgi:hypothetical protein
MNLVVGHNNPDEDVMPLSHSESAAVPPGRPRYGRGVLLEWKHNERAYRIHRPQQLQRFSWSCLGRRR